MSPRIDPDFPIAELDHDELEAIGTHIQEAEQHLQDALEILDGRRCVGRDTLAEAYSAVSYADTAIDGCISLKLQDDSTDEGRP